VLVCCGERSLTIHRTISETAASIWSPCQKFAPLNPPRVIHREYLDGSAANWRNALNNRSPEAEMIEPPITPRIEKRNNLLRYRIDTGQGRAFAEIAAVTREGEIA
jgi:hypothetical protein